MRVIKTKYNYDFYYILPDDLKSEHKLHSKKIIDDIIKLNIPNLKVIGINIKYEDEYSLNKKDTRLLIEYKNILYTPKYTSITKSFRGTIEVDRNNIYYYLYSKRPFEIHKLEIVDIPNKFKIFSKDYITIKCHNIDVNGNLCEYEYPITLNKFLSDKQCPKCTGQRIESLEEIKEQLLKNLHKNNFELISTSSENYPKEADLKIKCLDCDTIINKKVVSAKNGNIICDVCDTYNNTNFIEKIYKHTPFSKNPMHYYKIDDIINISSIIGNMCYDCGFEDICTVQDAKNGKKCQFCKGKYTNENVYFRIKQKRNYESEGIKIINIPDVNEKGVYTKIHYLCKRNHDCYMSISKFNLGQNCKKCLKYELSYGEKEIASLLEYSNVSYIEEYKFDDCRNIFQLPFDFYLPELNICIEYDGEQHFKSIPFYGGDDKFKKQQNNDQIKNQYCEDNNIRLIRIRYDEDPKEILTREGIIK
ncbi:hypothetical protein DIDNDMLP_00412 [Klebsiella phage KP13-7]|nr:hypothetical protein DIDNDMLP_00412 [Klebsiella phage KP13-7]